MYIYVGGRPVAAAEEDAMMLQQEEKHLSVVPSALAVPECYSSKCRCANLHIDAYHT